MLANVAMDRAGCKRPAQTADWDMNDKFKRARQNIQLLKDARKPKVKESKAIKAAIQPKLEARDYQQELFELAKDANLIVVLDTGLGKTLISVLLIQDTANKLRTQKQENQEQQPEYQISRPKLIFFLCNHIPLVYQQAAFIRETCNLRVCAFTGDDVEMLLSKEQWDKIYFTSDIMVCTAQILLDCLRHGFITLNDIALMIFDEVHHAKKKTPFALIMHEFYHRFSGPKPKIFGMTASPVDGHQNLYIAWDNLERTMDAKIETPEPGRFDGLTGLTSTVEVTLPYEGPSVFFVQEPNELTKKIQQIGSGNELLEKPLKDAEYILRELGPWACNRAWKDLVNTIKRKEGGLLNSQLNDLDAKSQAVKQFHQALEIISNFPLPKLKIKSAYLQACFSDKVYKLITYLCTWEDKEDFRCMIFVDRRHTANILGLILRDLSECPELSFIKPTVLVGHGRTQADDLSFMTKQQNRVVRDFRDGRSNLMVSTSVGEEGLDFQPCNLVIRFDMVDSLRSYIQSRGRARKKESRFVIMIDKKNFQKQDRLEKIRKQEQDLRMMRKNTHSSRRISVHRNIEDDFDDDNSSADGSDDYDDPLFNQPRYEIASTGAVLSPFGSIALIYRYCQCLQVDAYTDLRPSFTPIETTAGVYAFELSLPSVANFEPMVLDDVYPSRKQAKRMVAFNACILLHKRGSLDDHLLPDTSWKLDEQFKDYAQGNKRDKAGLKEGQRDSRRLYRVFKPSFWGAVKKEEQCTKEDVNEDTHAMIDLSPLDDVVSDETGSVHSESMGVDSQQWYGSIMIIDVGSVGLNPIDYRRMVIFTHSQLPEIPEFNLYFQTRPAAVSFIPIGVLEISTERQKLLQNYTLRLMGKLVNKPFRCDEPFSFLIAPLALGYNKSQVKLEELPWNEIEIGANENVTHMDVQTIEQTNDYIVIDFRDLNRRYFLKKVRYDLNPHSKPLDSEREQKYTSVLDYYEKEFGIVCKDNTQPLYEVVKMLRALNYLMPLEQILPARRGRVANFVIPEFCKADSIRASVFRTGMLMPSILTRLDSILLCHDFNHRFKTSISIIHLLEALTTSSAGQDVNYERLEFLGDAVLKLITTVFLFTTYTERLEGELNAKRARIINNRNLYKHARRLRISGYVRSHPFQRTAWRPPNFTIDKEKPDEGKKFRQFQVHGLSDKTMADLEEAVLGAAYKTGGLPMVVQVAKKLLIPLNGIESWDDLVKLCPTRNLVNMELMKKVDVERIESLIGYRFKNKLNLAEALTHSSALDQDAGCYQRLEFLGDALLDWCVVRYLFFECKPEDCEPVFTPGEFSDAKDAMVSNIFLSALCTRLGLHKHLLQCNARLPGALMQYSLALREKTEDEGITLPPHPALDEDYDPNVSFPPTGEYWIGCDYEAPKVMADMIEAMLGAVMVDSGYNLEMVDKVFRRLVLPTIISSGMYPRKVQVHPVTRLINWVNKQGCDEIRILNEHDQILLKIDTLEQALLVIQREGITGTADERLQELERAIEENMQELLQTREDEEEKGEDGTMDESGQNVDEKEEEQEEEEELVDEDMEIWGKVHGSGKIAHKKARENRFAAVIIHGECVSEASGESGRIARKMAAVEAMRNLEGPWASKFEKICNCRERREMERKKGLVHLDQVQSDEDLWIDPLSETIR